MPSSMDAASLVREARAGRFAPAIVDGPMAFDLAVSRTAAQGKAFDSQVAGRADAIVAPNVETGNALFKLMVCAMNASAAGVCRPRGASTDCANVPSRFGRIAFGICRSGFSVLECKHLIASRRLT